MMQAHASEDIPMSLTLTALLAAGLAPLPNVPVADLDLKRYSGQWHEVAHLPMFFQRNCVDQVTATYTPLANGRIRVDNACRDVKGKTLRSIGVARKVAGKPGQLEVRFAPGWLSWVPMVWADYWVVDLDPQYRWAVVGGPSHKYLWVLSRTPTMKRETFAQIKADAAARGYATEKLIMTAPLD